MPRFAARRGVGGLYVVHKGRRLSVALVDTSACAACAKHHGRPPIDHQRRSEGGVCAVAAAAAARYFATAAVIAADVVRRRARPWLQRPSIRCDGAPSAAVAAAGASAARPAATGKPISRRWRPCRVVAVAVAAHSRPPPSAERNTLWQSSRRTRGAKSAKSAGHAHASASHGGGDHPPLVPPVGHTGACPVPAADALHGAIAGAAGRVRWWIKAAGQRATPLVPQPTSTGRGVATRGRPRRGARGQQRPQPVRQPEDQGRRYGSAVMPDQDQGDEAFKAARHGRG